MIIVEKLARMLLALTIDVVIVCMEQDVRIRGRGERSVGVARFIRVWSVEL